MNQTILIVDDEESIQENLNRILAEEGYQIQSARSVQEGKTLLETSAFDLVLLDLKLPDDSGMGLLRRVREIYSAPLVIVMTGYATVDSAVEALKLGAYDHIKKPFKADAIKLIVRLALETQGLRRKVDALQMETHKGGVYDLVGESASLTELRQQILQVSTSEEATVLITGESGTGKELTARAIHSHSVRKDNPFIDINCASLPSNLLESELFGFEKGAFTDAKSRKPGYFELAHLPQEILSTGKQAVQGFQVTLPGEGISLPSFLASVEAELIRIALERTSNNITQAAKLLNVPRETLRYKLSRTGSV